MDKKILFLGCGKMGSILLSRLVEDAKFTFEIKRKVQVIIGLQQRYNDEEEEDDEEQDNTDMQTVVGTA